MQGYWHSKSHEPTIARMVGDVKEEVCPSEVPEILGMLPDYSGKEVVELAAGIGYLRCVNSIYFIC